MISRQSRPLLAVDPAFGRNVAEPFHNQWTDICWTGSVACLPLWFYGGKRRQWWCLISKKDQTGWLAQLFLQHWWGSANVFIGIPHSWNDLLNEAKWPLTPTDFAPDSFICCTQVIYYWWPPLQWPLALLTLHHEIHHRHNNIFIEEVEGSFYFWLLLSFLSV